MIQRTPSVTGGYFDVKKKNKRNNQLWAWVICEHIIMNYTKYYQVTHLKFLFTLRRYEYFSHVLIKKQFIF